MTNQNQKQQSNCDRFALIDLSTQQQESLTGGIGGNDSCIPPTLWYEKTNNYAEVRLPSES